MPDDVELYSRLMGEILAASARFAADECMEDDLPSAADLARNLNYRLETVKKKLRVLKAQGLIQPVTHTPKRYRFNAWALKSLDADHLLYGIFCEPGSPHFIAHH